MNFRCIQFILILTLAELIWSLPLACPYNGTSYKEGENVKTEEPCLTCICQKGALECSLRVCAEYPNVLPPDCFLVHKPNDCCPQILCDEGFTPTEIELRTDFKLKTKLHGNDCVINGSVYAEGSAVASSRVCEYCYCVAGEMKCIKPRCLQSFEGCKAVYEKSSCCPTHYDCRDADVDHLTFQLKNFAKVRSSVSSDPLKFLPSTDLSSSKEYFYDNESVATDFIKTECEPMDELTKKTAEEISTQETTVAPEEESTTSSAEDEITITGFQRADNFSDESTTVVFTEPTTIESETDTNVSSFTLMENQKETSSVHTRSKIDFRGDVENSAKTSENSSAQDSDDYDSYDYSEPQLPPSLPNVVIFPFVAADAVVKDENAGVSTPDEEVGIERIDAHPVFYKDYFSPPLRTEGGFVPKEPSKSDGSAYEQAYFNEHMKLPSAGSKKNVETQNQKNSSSLTLSGNCISDGQEILSTSGACVTCTCQSGEVVCQDDKCPDRKPEKIIFDNQKGTGNILESNPSVVLDSFGETLQPATETPSDFILKDEPTDFYKNYQTKKPVTVTYKNFVIDFYPNYLVTTNRGHFKLQTQNAMVSLTTTTTKTPPFALFRETETSIPVETTTEGTTTNNVSRVPITTSETSFLEEFVKSFLSKDTTSEPATATTKYKYSSKIKGHLVSTIKPKQEDIKEKEKIKMSEVNSTADLYSWLDPVANAEGVAEKPKNSSVMEAPAKKDDLNHIYFDQSSSSSSSIKPTEAKNSTIDFVESVEDANLSSDRRKGLVEKDGSESTSTKPSVDTLLKLAGCNIYGMMYRVGKIIMELSGPCLECLCTELGVQCKSLKC